MRSRLVHFGLGGALAGVVLVATTLAQGAPAPRPRTVEQIVTLTATVQAIDVAKREVTLK